MRGISRIVNTSFWEDEKVINDFSPEDKLFLLYVLTNPHTTQLGIYKLIPKVAAFELGYSKEDIEKLLQRFENKYRMIRYSTDTCEIAIKNFLRYSIIKGGQPVYDCLLKDVKQVKDKSLLAYIYNANAGRDDINKTVKAFLNTISGTLSTVNDNDNDNDNDSIVTVSCTDSVHESSNKYCSIVEAWNALSNLGIKPIRGIAKKGTRADQLRARIREHGEEAVIEAVDRIRNSDFLQGKNARGWMVTFDWFIKPANFQKVLEGNYDNRAENESLTGQDKYSKRIDAIEHWGKRFESNSDQIFDQV